MDDNYKHPADEKKVKFKLKILSTKKDSKKWTVLIVMVSFLLTASLSFVSSAILNDVNNIIAFCVVMLIIIISVVFDIIGTAVTAADEAPFHAMAARKMYGARQSIKLIRNADRVSNFCNDVIGDICGVISGAASAYIIIRISGSESGSDTTLAGLVISGIVASLTVGGKAFGKTVAIENCEYIVYRVGVILKFILGKIYFKRNAKKTGNSRKTKRK